MEADKSSVLGHLVEITADSFVAVLQTGQDGLLSEKMIGMDKVRIGQVGSYIMVKQSGHELLCTVESMWLETDANSREVYKLRVVPLGEFGTDRRFGRGISHYPTRFF